MSILEEERGVFKSEGRLYHGVCGSALTIGVRHVGLACPRLRCGVVPQLRELKFLGLSGDVPQFWPSFSLIDFVYP